MNIQLEKEWEEVTSDLLKPVGECWWKFVVNKYQQKGREAHNLSFLQRKFEELHSFRSVLSNVNAFILALFFQYFHYDSRDADFCTKNVESLEKFFEEAGPSKNEDLYQRVKYLLEASSVYSTEEHMTVGAYGNEDIHYFLDLDMVCLGMEPELYAQYAHGVAHEYSFLDTNAYKDLRRRVLRSFLLIPNIFVTKMFRDKYEAKARANIQKELDELAS